MKTLLLLHHSHTDVGYTDPQSRVEALHVDYIRQVLAILDRRGSQGFRWNCETFWAVERFLEAATEDERRTFVAAVRDGAIGLSASYLNFCELIDFDLLCRTTARAAAWGRESGIEVDSAMTADINGSGWGFADALWEAGARNLFTCVHTHHGMYPLGRTQTGFWWESPRGHRILVWNGEHYHYGNELGVVPWAVSSYLTKDECDAAMIFSDGYEVARIRIPRYVARLEREGYPFDLVPVMCSGLRTDNAPPAEGILDFVERWNREHGTRVRVEMATLTDFFHRLRAAAPDLPVHAGDWPDWWSDGAAGNPDATRRFRSAQRDLRTLRRLEALPEVTRRECADVEYDLTLYAEHTFGHAAAMSHPFRFEVRQLSARKQAFAARAADGVQALLEAATGDLGAILPRPGAPLRFEVVNPSNRTATDVVRLPVRHHEYHERGLDGEVAVRDTRTGRTLLSQREMVPLGAEFLAAVEMPPLSRLQLELAAGNGPAVVGPAGGSVERLETSWSAIDWRPGSGIVGWLDRRRDRDLLRNDHPFAALTPIHERTPVAAPEETCAVRGRMERNRKGPDVERSPGRLLGGRLVEDGPVLRVAVLDWELAGAETCSLELRAHMTCPRVDVALRIHKQSSWEPENVYLALPFRPATDRFETWLDRAGAHVRPQRDQIPGTLTDFFCVQDGVALVATDGGLAIATPDAHLVQLGPLEHGPRLLAGDPALERAPGHLYSWLMTNYWETNFEASLGGFHEFRFSIVWGEELNDPTSALGTCETLNTGLLCFRRS